MTPPLIVPAEAKRSPPQAPAKSRTRDAKRTLVIGSRRCGCVVSVLALGIGSPQDDAESIAEMERNDYSIRSITPEEFKNVTLGCKCGKAVKS